MRILKPNFKSYIMPIVLSMGLLSYVSIEFLNVVKLYGLVITGIFCSWMFVFAIAPILIVHSTSIHFLETGKRLTLKNAHGTTTIWADSIKSYEVLTLETGNRSYPTLFLRDSKARTIATFQFSPLESYEVDTFMASILRDYGA